MEFEKVIERFQDRPFFESRELVLLFEEPEAQVQARLSRWHRQGKLIQLRRGRYLLPEPYRRAEAAVFYIANYLHRPSYVSLQSALEHYGMIPEAVGVTLSITSLHGREWDTPIGRFRYRSIHPDRFWGYREVRLSGSDERGGQQSFLVADPEKAILDVFYLEPGEWTGERLAGLRLQNLDAIDAGRLRDAAERFRSARVQRAARRLLVQMEDLR
jgi:predicted transcriptional regulator of viral defense system